MLRLGRIVAWIAFILGAGRLAAGLLVASGGDPESRAAMAARYFASSTSGEAINQGLIVAVGAIVLGVLVNIARALNRS